MTETPHGGTHGGSQEGRWEDQVPEGINDELDEPLRRHLERDPSDLGGDDVTGGGEAPVEDTATYERAVEDGSVLPPGSEEGAGEPDDVTPVFREPGA